MLEMPAATLGVLAITSACLVVAIIVLGLALHLVRQQCARLQETSDRLARDVAVSTNTTLAMGQRLRELEKKLLEQQQSQVVHMPEVAALAPAAPTYTEEFHAYNEANQLFQMGLSVDEVVERCGLSRAEASLLEAIWQNESA